jgi:hypothetical protein
MRIRFMRLLRILKSPRYRTLHPDGSADAELSRVAGVKTAAIKSSMVAAANMVEVAALVGDTARATMPPH